MLGLLLVGLALILGIFMRMASYSGSLMLILIYLASLPLEHNPSQETNSVHIAFNPESDDLLYLAIMRRNAASVTSAIGASTKRGPFFFQNPFTIARIKQHYDENVNMI